MVLFQGFDWRLCVEFSFSGGGIYVAIRGAWSLWALGSLAVVGIVPGFVVDSDGLDALYKLVA